MTTLSKTEIRKTFLERRRTLPEARREEARKEAFLTLYEVLKGSPLILSFASLPEEIDLSLLNEKLAQEGRLLLSHLVSATEIMPCLVKDPKTELVIESKWGIAQPHPKHCTPCPCEKITCVLVPGVAFDSNRHRLGYGKGYYDRFLEPLSCPFFGVGFKEQLRDTPLPADAHDIALHDLFLF